MKIQHNIPALNASRNLKINTGATAKTLEKLSSGFKIGRAGDDAAGLAISEKMRGQIRGLSMAEQNASHGIDLIKTAEGGLNETHAILQRMRELAVQSSNGTYQNAVDRKQLQAEYHALKSEIDRIAASAHYNNIKLLDGSLSRCSGSTKPVDPTNPAGNKYVAEYFTALMDRLYAEGYVNTNKTYAGQNYLASVTAVQALFTTAATVLNESQMIADKGTYTGVPSDLAGCIDLFKVQVANSVTQILDMFPSLREDATLYAALIDPSEGAYGLGSALLGLNGNTGEWIPTMLFAGINENSINNPYPRPVAQAVAHEVMHALTMNIRACDGAHFFVEGVAELAAGFMYANDYATMQDLVSAGRTDGVGPLAAYMAYKSAQQYAVTTHGMTADDVEVTAEVLAFGMDRIFAAIKDAGVSGYGDPGAINQAVLDCTGMNFDDFQNALQSADGNQSTNDLEKFWQKFRAACGPDGAGSIASGNLSYSGEYVISNTALNGNTYGIDINYSALNAPSSSSAAAPLSAAQGIQPLASTPPPTDFDYTININTADGEDNSDYSFISGVLTIKSDKTFKIEGTGAQTSNRIVVDSGVEADIVLSNVHIETAEAAAVMDMRGATVKLWLEGANTLKNTADYQNGCAGIQTTNGNLTIDGTGTLEAGGGYGGAGIGGGPGGGDGGGTITINGGTVEATGGHFGAGIGGGHGGEGGNITINGGTVTAQGGGECGAGIGGGYKGDGGNITINGGTVNATGGASGAGIGGGFNGDGGNIEIGGNAVVEATGGTGAAGIGGGLSYAGSIGGDGGNIKIGGNANVKAKSVYGGAGIGGGGTGGDGGNIEIGGNAVVEATGGDNGAGIGGGDGGNGANLTITGGLVEAAGGDSAPNDVGGGHGSPGTTKVTGGNLVADRIHGDVTDGGATSYCVALNGDSFTPYKEVVVNIDGGAQWKGLADSEGKFYIYLPEGYSGADFTVTADGKTYKGTFTIAQNHNNTVTITPVSGPPGPTDPPGPSGPSDPSNTYGKGLVLQIGANGGADQRVTVYIENMSSRHIGIQSADGKLTANVWGTDIATIDNANAAISVLEGAINMVSGQRASLGAMQNRLEHALNNLGVTKENMQSAESIIRDADMAKEMMAFTKQQILTQAAQAMLAQANQLPQGVLAMLR